MILSEMYFQNNFVSDFWHLHNDIYQTFALTIFYSPPKLETILSTKQSVHNSENKSYWFGKVMAWLHPKKNKNIS
jgi:hypothetical protein